MISSRFLARGALTVLLLLVTASNVRGPESSVPSFSVAPGNPAAGQAVTFVETTAGEVPMSWLWEFGDGTVSTSPAPSKVWANAGTYTVRLTVTTMSGVQPAVTKAVVVSPQTTLRLSAAHPFDVTLFARDQRTGRTGDGLAIPQNDLFGYFAIPALTSNPDNPEMFVKILDGRAITGGFWVFYGGLTDLDVTLTVVEVATGITKTYQKAPGSACGGFDTSGFQPVVVTATSTPTPPGATSTPTPPAATPTPTAPGTTVVDLTAQQFEWKFNGGTNSFTMQVGHAYELRIHSIDSPGTDEEHSFGGVITLGISGTSGLEAGGSPIIRNFTPNASHLGSGGTPRFHVFACGLDTCGTGHDDMLGTIQIVP